MSLPSDFSGLTLWLKADALALSDTDPVTTWTDSSGSGVNPTQATAGKRPLYRTGQANGLPAVVFDGTDDVLAVAVTASTLFAAGAATVFLVQQQSTANAQTISLLWEGATGFTNRVGVLAAYEGTLFYDHGDLGAGLGRISAAQPPGWNTGFHVLECHRAAAPGAARILVDGAVLVNGTVTDDLDTTEAGTVQVGGTDTYAVYLGGAVAEVAAYNRELSEAERTSLRAGLAEKWGIALAPAGGGGFFPAPPPAGQWGGWLPPDQIPGSDERDDLERRLRRSRAQQRQAQQAARAAARSSLGRALGRRAGGGGR